MNKWDGNRVRKWEKKDGVYGWRKEDRKKEKKRVIEYGSSCLLYYLTPLPYAIFLVRENEAAINYNSIILAVWTPL